MEDRTEQTNVKQGFQMLAALHVTASKQREAFEQASDVVYEWARRKFSKTAVDLPGKKKTFDRTYEKEELGVLYDSANLQFALHCVEAEDWKDACRLTTDVRISRSGRQVLFAVRQMQASAAPCGGSVPAVCPAFVEQIIREVGLSDGIPITLEPHLLRAEYQVDSFVTFLQNPFRKMPVILLTPCTASSGGRQETYLLDPAQMARDLIGVAHVFEIKADVNGYLTEKIGRILSAFHGAVRTYYPGFSLNEAECYRHPMMTTENIKLRETVETEDPFLCLHEIEASVQSCRAQTPIVWDDYNIRFYLEIQPKQTRIQRTEPAVQKENAGESQEKTVARVPKKPKAQSAVNRIQRTSSHSYPLPSHVNYENLSSWINSYFSDRLILHQRAIRSLKKATFADVVLVYRCLELLATSYYDYRTGKIDRKDFEQACRAIHPGLTEAASITEKSAGEQKDTYYVRYHKKKRMMERHLRKGTQREGRYCLRIYFFWDNERKKTVICDLPNHLRTTKT